MDDPMAPDPARRRPELDALRGLAAALMLNQHLGFWLWQRPAAGGRISGWFVGLNALGGLAAPLFLALAGVGCSLLAAAARGRTDRRLLARGLALMALGYLLNVLTPTWFSPLSWYVLHMLGLAAAVAPLARRLPTPWLLGLATAVVAATPAVQHWLGTPERLTNERMRDLSLGGGALRLALAEGQFPVLPWLSVYLAGMVAGRHLAAGRTRAVAHLGAACLAAAAALVALGLVLPPGAEAGPLGAALRLRVGFFPASPPMVLGLAGAAVLLIAAASHLWRAGPPPWAGPLVAMGRTSLTVLLVHVVVFRQVARSMGVAMNVGTAGTLAAITGAIAVSAALSLLWRRAGYRYGAEWLLRVASHVAAGDGQAPRPS